MDQDLKQKIEKKSKEIIEVWCFLNAGGNVLVALIFVMFFLDLGEGSWNMDFWYMMYLVPGVICVALVCCIIAKITHYLKKFQIVEYLLVISALINIFAFLIVRNMFGSHYSMYEEYVVKFLIASGILNALAWVFVHMQVMKIEQVKKKEEENMGDKHDVL